MSIIYCEKHDLRWDSDFKEECPRCEDEHAAGGTPAAQREAVSQWRMVEPPVGHVTAQMPEHPVYCIVRSQWWRFDMPALPHICREKMYFDDTCAACVADLTTTNASTSTRT